MFDEELLEMDRDDRINAMDLPIGLGDQNRKFYYHAKIDPENVTMHELEDPPDAMRGMDTKMTLDWEPDATKILMTIPPGVRKMVAENTEDFVKEKGEEVVTLDLFQEMTAAQGMSTDFFDRFRDERKKKTA